MFRSLPDLRVLAEVNDIPLLGLIEFLSCIVHVDDNRPVWQAHVYVRLNMSSSTSVRAITCRTTTSNSPLLYLTTLGLVVPAAKESFHRQN